MEPETIVIPDSDLVPADPPDMAAVRKYFAALQIDLTTRVSAIELFFGFVEGTEALSVRVGKLERFVFGAK
jgi:hypothetical protein